MDFLMESINPYSANGCQRQSILRRHLIHGKVSIPGEKTKFYLFDLTLHHF
jgi:hypothetical protein